MTLAITELANNENGILYDYSDTYDDGGDSLTEFTLYAEGTNSAAGTPGLDGDCLVLVCISSTTAIRASHAVSVLGVAVDGWGLSFESVRGHVEWTSGVPDPLRGSRLYLFAAVNDGGAQAASDLVVTFTQPQQGASIDVLAVTGTPLADLDPLVSDILQSGGDTGTGDETEVIVPLGTFDNAANRPFIMVGSNTGSFMVPSAGYTQLGPDNDIDVGQTTALNTFWNPDSADDNPSCTYDSPEDDVDWGGIAIELVDADPDEGTTGTAAVTAAPATVAVAAKEKIPATGALSAAKATVAVAAREKFNANAGVSASAATAAVVAKESIKPSAAVSASGASVAVAAKEIIRATVGVVASPATVAVVRQSIGSTVAVSASPGLAAGVIGTFDHVTGTVAVSAAHAGIAVVAGVPITGAVSVSANPAVSAVTGRERITATGAVMAASGTVAATGTETIHASADLSALPAVVAASSAVATPIAATVAVAASHASVHIEGVREAPAGRPVSGPTRAASIGRTNSVGPARAPNSTTTTTGPNRARERAA